MWKIALGFLFFCHYIESYLFDTFQVGFDQLGGTDEFSTEELEERLAKSQVIIFEGESSINQTRSNASTRRSVQQSADTNSSDSE